jgi:hypothetical protein
MILNFKSSKNAQQNRKNQEEEENKARKPSEIIIKNKKKTKNEGAYMMGSGTYASARGRSEQRRARGWSIGIARLALLPPGSYAPTRRCSHRVAHPARVVDRPG